MMDNQRMAQMADRVAKNLTGAATDLDQRRVIVGQIYTKLDRAIGELLEDPMSVRASLMVTKYGISLEGEVHRLWKAVKASRSAKSD